MTLSSPKTASPIGWQADPEKRIARLIVLARASVAAERVLPALWPALGFLGFYLALAWCGLFAFVPWTLQALILAVTITATGLSLANSFTALSWPDDHDGRRRLERDSGLAHRPISESDDRLIGNDPFAQELWRLHRLRAWPTQGLRVAWPAPDLHRRDPKNLRYMVLLALGVGLVMARGEWRTRLIAAFDSGAGTTVTLDAWIDPPPYTGLPPVYLARGDTSIIPVPAGSILNLRAHGADHAPGVALGANRSTDGRPAHFGGDAGEYAVGAPITHDALVRVRSGGHRIGMWNLRAVPDRAPVIAFDGVPKRTEHDAVQFSFKAQDDYGVTSAHVILRPHGRGGAPLIVDLPLAAAKKITQTTFADLTGHPYAGLAVDATLEARDGAGQTGRSTAVTFVLPARVFTNPLARALIEQRQNLATSHSRSDVLVVARVLDALTLAPEKFYDGQTGLYLALRAAYWGLRSAHAEADIAHVEDLLWQIAANLERSGMLADAEDLRRLQALITQALAAHAPQEVIDQLLQRYNETMQRYMRAMAANPPSAAQHQAGPDTKTLGEQDIQALLKAIQQLSQSGDREKAAQLLAVLQNLLENLRVAGNGGGGNGSGGAGDKALNDAMQKFGDMMGKQRALLDKTMRQNQGSGDPKDGGAQGLAKQQGQLQGQLDQMMKGLDPKAKAALAPADKAMDNARQSLGQNQLDNAGNDQKNALEALRKGADALAKQAQANSQGGSPQGDNEDPLGRSKGGLGSGVKIPGAGDLARSREILQELRRRAGERGRPQQELDYIDRLLKEF